MPRSIARRLFPNQTYSVSVPTTVAFESGPNWQRVILENPGNQRTFRALAFFFGFFVVVLFVPLLDSMTTGGTDLIIFVSLFGLNFALMSFWIWFGSSSQGQVILERRADGVLLVATRLGHRRLDPASISVGLFSVGNADSILFASCCSGALIYEKDRPLFPAVCSSPENASHVLSALISFLGTSKSRDPIELETVVAQMNFGTITLNTGSLGMRDPVLRSRD